MFFADKSLIGKTVYIYECSGHPELNHTKGVIEQIIISACDKAEPKTSLIGTWDDKIALDCENDYFCIIDS